MTPPRLIPWRRFCVGLRSEMRGRVLGFAALNANLRICWRLALWRRYGFVGRFSAASCARPFNAQVARRVTGQAGIKRARMVGYAAPGDVEVWQSPHATNPPYASGVQIGGVG